MMTFIESIFGMDRKDESNTGKPSRELDYLFQNPLIQFNSPTLEVYN